MIPAWQVKKVRPREYEWLASSHNLRVKLVNQLGFRQETKTPLRWVIYEGTFTKREEWGLTKPGRSGEAAVTRSWLQRVLYRGAAWWGCDLGQKDPLGFRDFAGESWRNTCPPTSWRLSLLANLSRKPHRSASQAQGTTESGSWGAKGYNRRF